MFANASAGMSACLLNATETVPSISINFRFDFKVHFCTSHELATM